MSRGNPYEAILRGAAIGVGLGLLFSLFAWTTYYEPPPKHASPEQDIGRETV